MVDLSGCEVEVPGEVIRSFVGTETAMLAVVGFQALEVSFQPVGSGRDLRVVEVVEHVGQSSQEHAASTLYIAEDPTRFFACCYLCTVTGFPRCCAVEKRRPGTRRRFGVRRHWRAG